MKKTMKKMMKTNGRITEDEYFGSLRGEPTSTFEEEDHEL